MRLNEVVWHGLLDFHAAVRLLLFDFGPGLDQLDGAVVVEGLRVHPELLQNVVLNRVVDDEQKDCASPSLVVPRDVWTAALIFGQVLTGLLLRLEPV